MKRVSFDDLSCSDDGYGDVLLGDHLFDGIAVAAASTGEKGETVYSSGKRHGPSRSWYASGTQKVEEYFLAGARHGTWREWRDGGQLLREEIWQFSLPLVRRRWNERGTLEEDVNLLVGNADRQDTWLAWRSQWGPLGIVELEDDELVERPWPFDDLLPAELAARITP